MRRFILLTNLMDRDILIPLDIIRTVGEDDEGGSVIHFMDTAAMELVQESPEHIAQFINEMER